MATHLKWNDENKDLFVAVWEDVFDECPSSSNEDNCYKEQDSPHPTTRELTQSTSHTGTTLQSVSETTTLGIQRWNLCDMF